MCRGGVMPAAMTPQTQAATLTPDLGAHLPPVAAVLGQPADRPPPHRQGAGPAAPDRRDRIVRDQCAACLSASCSRSTVGALSPVGASRALVERACELQSPGILSVADGDASKGNGQDLMVGPGPVDPIGALVDHWTRRPTTIRVERHKSRPDPRRSVVRCQFSVVRCQ